MNKPANELGKQPDESDLKIGICVGVDSVVGLHDQIALAVSLQQALLFARGDV